MREEQGREGISEQEMFEAISEWWAMVKQLQAYPQYFLLCTAPNLDETYQEWTSQHLNDKPATDYATDQHWLILSQKVWSLSKRIALLNLPAL